jgi:hypothetical protein
LGVRLSGDLSAQFAHTGVIGRIEEGYWFSLEFERMFGHTEAIYLGEISVD